MMFEVWKRSRGPLRWLRRQRQGWLGIFFSALRQTLSADTSLTAAAISYFALFSFFPLLIFTTAIAGTWLDPILDRSQIIEQLNFVAPALGYLLEQQLQRIAGLEQTITGLALLSLLWSASSIFHVLRRTLDRIWNMGVARSAWHHRGMAVVTVLVISALLLLASIAHSIVVTILEVFTPYQLQQFGHLASQIAAFAVSVLLFALLYRFLPHFPIEWRDIWPGAVSAGLLWEIVKRVFLFYATHYLAQASLTLLVYGSVATITGFLAWSYTSSIIFIFGAHVNVCYCQRRKRIAEAGQK